MSIKLYSGLPGSGKTYRVVKELIDSYQDDYCIIHNIVGLSDSAFKPGSYVRSFAPDNNQLGIDPISLFTLSTQRKIVAELLEKYNKPLLVVIDECDKIGFDRPDKLIKEWLSQHRHIGQDILLITQHLFNINRDYNHLIDVEIQAKRGFVFNSFIYSWKSQGSAFKIDRLKKEQRIFDAYQSFEFGEKKKKTVSLWKWMILFGGIAIVGLIWTIFFMYPARAHKINAINQARHGVVASETTTAVTPSTLPEKVSQLYFSGLVGDRVILHDSDGNIFRSEVMEFADLFRADLHFRTVKLLNSETGTVELSNSYVLDTLAPTTGQGRQRDLPRDSPKKKEIWIEIR